MQISFRRWSGRRFLSLSVGSAMLAAIICFPACDRADQKPPITDEKITIACATLPETAVAQVAKSRGYYREERLDAAVRLHAYGKLALQDVLEGRADFATVAETPVMFAVLGGEKIAIIATIQTSKKNHAIIARKDRGVRTPQDLKGKKIATTAGITADYYMDAFLATQGIARRDITIVNLKPEDCESAIASGVVDAVSTFYPHLSRVQKKLGENGITFYDEDIYTETFNVVATQEFVRAHPGIVRKMLRALIKAEAFIAENQDASQKIVAEFCGIGIDLVREIWTDSHFAVRLDQSLILALEDESRWAINGGLTRAGKVPNYLDFIYFDGLATVKPQAMMILR